MWLLSLVLAAQTPIHSRHGPSDTVPPYVVFPQPGLDDSAAYQGYATRVYRDAKGNAFQVYLNRRLGRVANVWADALNESVGFTVRDSSGRPAMLDWGSSGAVVTKTDTTRSVAYELETGPAVRIGLFLLGSMRVERDLGYSHRDSLPLDSAAFPQPELTDLIATLGRLDSGTQRDHLALLRARSVGALRGRIEPSVTARTAGTRWRVQVDQVSFDGRSRLSLILQGDSRTSVAMVAGRQVKVRSRAGRPVRIEVLVTTDAASLTSLDRSEIFQSTFLHSPPRISLPRIPAEPPGRLEREIRGMELLCYREKLMAGLPNFATYFGRDGMMTALLMEPIWTVEMREHAIAAVLAKLAPDGDVSHEEALGGQAIREHAAIYNHLIEQYLRSHADSLLREASDTLANLQLVRENYRMVDDDYQLPVLEARYFSDTTIPLDRKRRFLLEPASGPGSPSRLRAMLRNLAFVAARVAPYAHDPVAQNLVAFPPDGAGGWVSSSWRDSRVGYAGGRYAMDVNVVWAPLALSGTAQILDVLAQLGWSADSLETQAPEIRVTMFDGAIRHRAALTAAIATWQGTARHFEVVLPPAEWQGRVDRWLGSLPERERAYWTSWRTRVPPPDSQALRDTLRFLALSLDSAALPIPVMSSDPAMWLLLDDPAPRWVEEAVAPFWNPYPLGLFIHGVGPAVANDAFAGPAVWSMFRNDLYHSPKVVWGREVSTLLAALAQRIRASYSDARLNLVVRTLAAVQVSGLGHHELWSYEVTPDTVRAVRYGTSSDVQLWSLADLAVQFHLSRMFPPGP